MSIINKDNNSNISVRVGIIDISDNGRGACWKFNVSSQFPITDIYKEDGEAVVTCGPPHEGYSIQTVLKNGKPNGESYILDRENVIIASLTFIDGVVTGPCMLYDDVGCLFFEGYYVNGYREGKGKEFDEDGNIVFEGFFKEGKKLNIVRMDEMEGYWKEMNDENEIVSICRKNDSCGNEGICYFYSNGKIEKVSEWKNGVEVNVLKRFDGEKMIEFENGVKRYEGEYEDNVVDGYPREGSGKELCEDGKSLLYRGSFLNGKREGEGMEYKNGRMIYKGNWRNGNRDGEGLEYENGKVIYKGNWRDGVRVVIMTIGISSDLVKMSASVTDLVISSNCCNDVSSLDLNGCEWLYSIEIGNECFENVDTFRIDGLNSLKSIKIGKNSFTKKRNSMGDNPSRSFHILNCEKLEWIEIGKFSFSDYGGEFELKNLPSLSSIKIGDIGSMSWNFCYSSFVVEGMIIIDI